MIKQILFILYGAVALLLVACNGKPVSSTVKPVVLPVKAKVAVKLHLPALLAAAPARVRYNADIPYGSIGTHNKWHIDNPYDNIFHIKLDRLPAADEVICLQYQLKGVTDHTGIARSINDGQSTGGNFVQFSDQWSAQKEYLANPEVRTGDNVLRFGLNDEANYNYEVKDVSLVIVKRPAADPLLLNTEHTAYFGKQAYVSGVLNTSARLFCDGQPVDVHDGEFEVVVTNPKGDTSSFEAEMVAILPSGKTIVKKINFSSPQIANRIVSPGMKAITNAAAYQRSADLSLGLRTHGRQATLHVPAGALASPATISITALRAEDMPPIGPDMVNVTGGARAYRFLPHGSRFARPVHLDLPVDTAFLPAGYTKDDVHTFFFDETARTWVALPADTAGVPEGAVGAVTTHFTDMIAGVIKVPESPQTQGYTPTSIKDYKAADPSAGIEMIAPPSANNMGSASLSFPIKVPNGRLGMQPNLNLQYSNEGGNGWLGLGWSLSVPVIDIDTRWGVPRYDKGLETETYTMNGEPLAPLANRSAFVPRVPERQFHPRVEGSFQRVIRHGNDPAAYWWEVTNKNGVRSFYGGTPEGGVKDSAVLKDAAGNVAKWALVETRDMHKNTVTYHYDKQVNPNVAIGSNGSQLYISKINYTGNGTADGHYNVTFDREQRNDVEISGRLGFKMVTADRLNRISIYFDTKLVRRYIFDFGYGEFSKTLLTNISEHDSEGHLFYSHKFDYYDDVKSGNSNLFLGNDENWSPPNDNIRGGLRNPLPKFSDESSALSTSRSNSAGGALALLIGLGYSQDKTFSVGGSVGYESGDNEGLVTMVDVNGDGLPDKIIKHDGVLRYRANLGLASHTFGDLKPITGIGNFSRGETRTIKTNVQAVPYYGFVGYEHSSTTNRTKEYFADFNGDGLIDLASNGQVYFNRLNTNGDPVFDLSSTGTPSVIVPDGDVDKKFLAPDMALQQMQETNFPLQDVVRVWQAPFRGQVTISGPVQLSGNSSGLVTKEDGVRASVQVRNENPRWAMVIPAGDHGIKNPVNVTNIAVSKGDKIYFRLQSRYNGENDVVKWDPVIDYAADPVPASDANARSSKHYRASEDFVLDNKKGAFMVKDGFVKIDGTFLKQRTSDSVTLLINRVSSSGSITKVFGKGYRAGTLASGFAPLTNIPVGQGDTLKFYIISDTYIDRARIQWLPHYAYTSFSDGSPVTNSNGGPAMEASVVPDNTNYNEWHTTAPLFKWLAADTIKIAADIAGGPAATGKVVFTVKGADTVYAKQILQLNGGALSAPPDSVRLVLRPNENYYFDYTTADQNLAKAITKVQASIKIDSTFKVGGVVLHKTFVDHIKANLYTNPATSFLGPLFRGWGQFSIKGDKESTALVDESRLNPNQYQNFPNDPATYTDTARLNTLQNPTASYFMMMYADGKRDLWMGNDTAVYVAAGKMSSSRLFLHDVSVDSLMVGASLRAAEKINTSSGKNYTLGIGVNASFSSTTNSTTLDMMDMNGDRYPDVLNELNVQYSKPTGGLELGIHAPHNLGPASGEGNSTGLTLGGDFLKAEGTTKVILNAVSTAQNAMASIGIGSGFANSNEQVGNTAWIDVNGDGLPDKVYKDGNVALNLGYQFEPPENWGIGGIDRSSSKSEHGGNAINLFGGSWEFGYGLNRSTTIGSYTLSDVNGDGLVDQVYSDGVQLNIGNGFGPKISWSGLSDFSNNVSTGESINSAFTIAFNPFFFLPVKIVINPSVTIGHSVSHEQGQIMDIDGDGFPDILHSNNDGDLHVRRSTIGRTNMLKTVHRPMGSYFTMDYQRIGNTYRMPQNKWVLKNVEIFDGVAGDGVDTMRNSFTYKGGYYDRHEREFYGFDTVITNQLNTAAHNAVYRSTVQQYINTSYYAKGLIAKEWMQDAAGHRFTETNNEYEPRTVQQDVVFPALKLNTKLFYEGQSSAGISTATSFDYDGLGNITNIYDQGDGSDKDLIHAVITYHNLASSHIVGIPASIKVTTTEGLKRSRDTKINDMGDITQINQHLKDGPVSVYDLDYDPYGNLAKIKRPENSKGERMFYAYTYDSSIHTYVTKVTDAYGYSSRSHYNLLWGSADTTVSMNNEPMYLSYDQRGRLENIAGPFEIQNKIPYTIKFEYPTVITTATPAINGAYFAVTHHYDPEYGPGNDINTVTFMDGLGRPLQVKKQVSLFDGKEKLDQLKMVVSGRILYDAFGRALSNYYPVTEPLSAVNNNILNTALGNINSTTSYDVMDRPLTEVLADGATSKMAYTTAGGFFVTSATDAMKNVRESVTDVKGRKREDHALNGPAGIINTKFSYNALSELTKVEDNSGNAILYTYDNLGRKMSTQNPDAGLTTFVYDPAGNLTKKVTAQTRKEIPNGGAINYQYDHERLTGIDYQRQYQNKVTYVYGPPATGQLALQDDRAGRLILQEDASGGLEFYYGKLGEVTKQIRTVMVNTVFYTTYVSEQHYDTWNRLKEMTYPDGERLSYFYNHGGNLDSIVGMKENIPYKYVNRLGYDEYEQRVYLKYGNNTETNYAYDNQRRRLTSLTATTATGAFMMNNTYGYDAVSNILNVTNSAKAGTDKLIGSSAQNYTYDNLYRLVSASGSFKGATDSANYTLAMGYDNLYNITSKKLTTGRVSESYAQEYAYAGTVHQATDIGKNKYTFDLNGNLSTFGDKLNPAKRQYFWDEENRLMAVLDSTGQSQYTYDAGGERIIKSSGSFQGNWVNGAPAGTANHYNNYTVYVSPFLVCRRTTFTKHIYIESQRIATKIGNGQFLNISFPQSEITAGGINFINRAKQLQRDRVSYYANEKVSPGPPTQKLYFAEPQNNGIAAPVLVDSTYAVPPGWPGNTTPATDGPPTFVEPIPSNADAQAGYGFRDTVHNKLENNQYFYHSDHLGSTAYTTDVQGVPAQHQEYVPFGETYVDKHVGSYNSPYLFNAKELDSETGLYYYGARYYDPKQSQWISVDPMVDKYPALSPYNYTLNNPVRLVDPNGKAPIYDRQGSLMGTDDHGIGGRAIVMNKTDFTQGMNSDDASSKNLGLKSLIGWKAEASFLSSFSAISSRPDFDGFVTPSEGVKWAKSHPGALENPTAENTLYLDASKLDLGNLSTSKLKLKSATPVNLLSGRNLIASVLNPTLKGSVYALGRADVQLEDEKTGSVKIVNNSATDYDWNTGGGFRRNTLINIERWTKGLDDSNGFKVFYYGTAKVKKDP